MSKPNIKVAILAALALILPFAFGVVHAAEPMKEKSEKPPIEKPVQPPTIDTNGDGKADGWDRDGNGLVDAWDTDGDGKPNVFDDDADGKPDADKAPAPAEPNSPSNQR